MAPGPWLLDETADRQTGSLKGGALVVGMEGQHGRGRH